MDKLYPREQILPTIALLSTIVITPGLTFDPQVLPKFVTFSLAVIVAYCILYPRSFSQLDNILKFIIIWFITAIIVATVMRTNNLSEQIYGVFGRNNGALMYLCSALLFILGFSCNTRKLINQLTKMLRLSNIFVVFYFILQYFKIDPIEWERSYSIPSSTLGNPNFVSAFVSFSIFAHIEYLREDNLIWKKISSSVFFALGIIVIFLSDSDQGFFLFLIGLTIYLILKKQLLQTNFRQFVFSIMFVFFILLFLIGIFRLGPFASMFLDGTLAIRKEYWLAGLRIFQDAPWIGHGYDSYLYYFDAYKSPEFVAQYGYTQSSSSSHNLFIDLIVGGGLLTAIPFLLLALYQLKSVMHILKSTNFSHSETTNLIVFWTIINLQFLFSVPHITFIAWQSLIAGALCKYAATKENRQKRLLVEKVQNIVDSLLVRLVVGLTLTCCCIFSFTQDIRFLSSVKSSNAEVLVRVVNSFPRDTFRSNYAAEILVSSKYLRSSRIVILESLRNNPRNLQGWKMLLQNPMATQSEKKLALKRISELTND